MYELASISVRAVKVLVELLAELSFVILRDVDLLKKFVRAMSEGAIIMELTEASLLPIFANFSLILYSKAFNVLVHFLFRAKLLLSSIYVTKVLSNISNLLSLILNSKLWLW
jgi:hypothetical protein